MTSDEMRKAAERIVERTTREQGLPEKVEDPVTLARIADILLPFATAVFDATTAIIERPRP